ncbi:MAG: LPXTG cell wall anchor domain-containing protein [Clostridia bacterium]|nr:LPXTG cell wall anchor domain-containing protein [Clostridia bacterium]
MKKFIIFLLAALLVVAMGTIAVASAAETSGTTGKQTGEFGNGTLSDGSDNISGHVTGKDQKACDGVNHTYVPFVITASCDGAEYTIQVCSGCGHEKTQSEGADWRVKTGDALGHVWDEANAVIVSKGDCQTPGSVTKTCKRCGATKTFATEGSHNWSDWSVVAKETCVQAGTYKRYCSICGKVDVKNVVPTGKHIFDAKSVKKKATCTAWGTYEAQCTLCGKYFTYSGNDTDATKDGTIVLKIAKRNHNMGAAVVTAATCQKDGQIVQRCLNTMATELYEACDYVVTTTISKDTMAYNPAVKDTIKKYHNLKWVPETKDGMVGHYACTVAGCDYVSQEVVKYSGDPNAVSKTSTGTAVATGTTTSKTTGKTTGKTSSSTNKKGVSIPKTNDTTSNLPYVLIAVAFVGLVALVASKKKVNG